jgi:hypothetical protein
VYTAFHSFGRYKRWAGTNLNDASFASLIPTLTKPVASATSAVLDLTDGIADGGKIPTWIKMLFIGLGAADDVTSFRLVGWNKVQVGQGVNPDTIWIPQPFAEFSVTFSTAVGIAASPVLNTEAFADTIAPVALMLEDQKIAAGTSLLSDCRIFTPANNTPGHVVMPIRGFELIQFTSDQTTGTSTCNILYTFLR